MVVVIALMTFVVPKVVDQFDSMGQTLPLLTRIVIGLSDGHAQLRLARCCCCWRSAASPSPRACRQPGFPAGGRRRLLRLPLIGRLTRDLHAARLARTLSTMIASGLPVLEGLLHHRPHRPQPVLRGATEGMADARSARAAACRRPCAGPTSSRRS